jgi:tRNA (guanine37-N1)-methyltransferase
VHIDILTLFPDMFVGPFDQSMIKRAREAHIVEIELFDIRAFALDKHKTTDDYPYGGGAGMIMKPEPIVRCLDHVRHLREGLDGEVVLLSPQGALFSQKVAKELAAKEHLVLICGHYEGIDERIYEYVDREVSIGDYVLTGGEIPAMVVVDVVCRLLPGVLGSGPAGAMDDSIAHGLLEHPQYTRPREFAGHEVPEVLLSGHHAQIELWRRKESLRRTLLKRPELLQAAPLEERDQKLLQEIREEEGLLET